MEIKEEIKALTEKQKKLIDQSVQINLEKIERLNEVYGKYPKNYARLDKILKKYDELLGSKNNYTNDKEAISKLYMRLCQKIFSESIKLDKKYIVESNNHSWYCPSKEDKIAFTRRGLAYKPSYCSRLRTIDDIAFTIKYFNKDKSMRDLPLSKRKLEMWQKFYDLILPFNFHENKIEESIKLKEPIRTVSEQERSFSKDEYDHIKYRDIREVTIGRIDIDINQYRREISFIKESNGDTVFRINFSRGDYDETDNRYIKHVINQLPEEIFLKLEKFINDVETATDTNRAIYEKMKEDFGHLILSEEI